MPAKQKSNLVQILWICLGLLFLVEAIEILANLMGVSLLIYPFFENLVILIPACLILLHQFHSLGGQKAVTFFSLAFITGLFFEIIGVQFGTTFGGHYVYNFGQTAMILGVPLIVPLHWSIFIYTGYAITSSFLVWTDKKKPGWKNKKSFLLLPLLVILDGILVVAIDLVMDPLQVMAGKWTWLDGGAYYDIPLDNFLGWFLVTIIATGFFRTIEYYYPKRQTKINKKQSLQIIPVLAYGSLCIFLCSNAVHLQLPELAMIGILAMMPIVIINVFLYIFWQIKYKFAFLPRPLAKIFLQIK